MRDKLIPHRVIKQLPVYLLFLITVLVVFRNLLFGFGSALIDWRDYPFFVWSVNSITEKIINLNFQGFFTTNAFYPNTNTLFFSDLLIPQSLLAVPFRLFTDNPIAAFNAVFLITFLLNFLSLFAFWGLFFRTPIAAAASFIFAFSAFFFSELSHFQMLSYWPFILSLYSLIHAHRTGLFKWGIISGVFAAIQFIASVYLGIFLLFTLLIYLLTQIFTRKPDIKLIYNTAGSLVTFTLLSLFFIIGYIRVKEQYETNRNSQEFIKYSAHISDYVFPVKGSLLSETAPIEKWISLDKHNVGEKAAFPGFAVSSLAMIGLFIKRKFDRADLFFLLLLVCGIIFSLGPTLNVNGQHTRLILPYDVLLKSVPFLDAVRALARWSFLFYLGIAYFASKALEVIYLKNGYLLLSLLSMLWIIEGFPFGILAESKEYTRDYEVVRDLCLDHKQVLLEVPITHFDGKAGLARGLSRVTTYELSSLYHHCYLVNGYSGFDLPSLITFKNRFYRFFLAHDFQGLYQFLRNNQVTLLKIHSGELGPEVVSSYADFVSFTENSKKFIPLDEGLFQVSDRP